MKLFTTKQIATLDRFTIENEPITDIDLMERAALQITGWLVKRFSTEQKMIFFAGPGNNGGDALAVARQIAELGFICEVFILNIGKSLSDSAATNLNRLQKQARVKITTLNSISEFPETKPTDIIGDGLFGSGLTRPMEGFAAEVVQKINRLPNTVIAIDIPSGLMGEDNTTNLSENIIQADYTLTFQFPKLSFLFPENEQFTGKWEVLPIGLHQVGIVKTESHFCFIEIEDIQQIIQPRQKFAHKGTFGHTLLIAGSLGKTGAAVLAAKGCLRAGAGLLTVHLPGKSNQVLQIAVPEAMTSIDHHKYFVTEIPDLTPYAAIAMGPGIGKAPETQQALHQLLKSTRKPLVIDADALNILADNPEWLTLLPENAILTPHPGEFRRLTGESANSWDQLQKQIRFSKEYKVIVVLKGAFTSVSTPEGKVYFNSTGNPGMATAGSGDALTGIISGLLSQGIYAEKAAIAGVFLHGYAGDLASAKKSEYAMIAGDIIDSLGEAFLTLKSMAE